MKFALGSTVHLQTLSLALALVVSGNAALFLAEADRSESVLVGGVEVASADATGTDAVAEGEDALQGPIVPLFAGDEWLVDEVLPLTDQEILVADFSGPRKSVKAPQDAAMGSVFVRADDRNNALIGAAVLAAPLLLAAATDMFGSSGSSGGGSGESNLTGQGGGDAGGPVLVGLDDPNQSGGEYPDNGYPENDGGDDRPHSGSNGEQPVPEPGSGLLFALGSVIAARAVRREV